MANPTTNYGFVLPTPTDLVTDLPADFDVALQGVDTQMLTNANAATAKATLTTKGDIYAATAASTVSRLAVGTDGQVLTADSSAATGLKYATPGVAFVGVGAVQTSGTLAVIANTVHAVPLGTADQWDTDAFHDISTNNSRITIPAGKAGKYLVTAAIVPSSTANYAFLYYLLNGTATGVPTGNPGAFITRIQGNAANSYGLFGSLVVNLAVADYIQMGFFSDHTGTITYDARFTATLLGA